MTEFQQGYPSTLTGLLASCTVEVINSNQNKKISGTGFCVAPNLILTCAHLVPNLGQGAKVKIVGSSKQNLPDATIKHAYANCDLALLEFDGSLVNIPCVYLDEHFKEWEDLYIYGYPKGAFNDGCPVTAKCEGHAWDEGRPFIKFKMGEVQDGLSGSPLLNRTTGKVCGVVKATRDPHSDRGGTAIPTGEVFKAFPELQQLQTVFHNQDPRWTDSLPRSSQPTSEATLKHSDQLPNRVSEDQRTIPEVSAQDDTHKVYLMIRIEKSKGRGGDYIVQAWCVPDEGSCDYRTGEGYKELNIIDDQYTQAEIYAWDELFERAWGELSPGDQKKLNKLSSFMEDIILQANHHAYEILCCQGAQIEYPEVIIEFFLPNELLNHGVCAWVHHPFKKVMQPIGTVYMVVVRSLERQSKNHYFNRSDWKKKWDDFRHSSSAAAFANGDCELEQLPGRLNERPACKLTKAPKKEVFDKLVATGAPVAIWPRRDLAGIDTERAVDTLLVDDSVLKLPKRVKEKRKDAFYTNRTERLSHIGHQLSLLWDDPKRHLPS